MAIERSYDDAGRLHSVRSRSSDSSNPVVNEVEFGTPISKMAVYGSIDALLACFRTHDRGPR